jgi:hypothetical protein
MGKEISFKAEKKGRERSDLFSKHLTWSNAMDRKVRKYTICYVLIYGSTILLTLLHKQMHHHIKATSANAIFKFETIFSSISDNHPPHQNSHKNRNTTHKNDDFMFKSNTQ